MAINPDNFPQYSPGIADQSYQFDFITRISVSAGGTASVTFPAQSNIIRIRSIVVEDVTVATGGTAPSTPIAAYFRFDGILASASLDTATKSGSRILRANTATFNYARTVNRFISTENGVSFFNPNGAAVVIQVELGA